MKNIYFGNTYKDGENRRGWFVGHFMEPDNSIRSTQDVEVKWGVHKKGEIREWSFGDVPKTVSITIKGKWRIEFRDSEYVLNNEGDYVAYEGKEHRWEILEDDTVVLTVRWPSLPSDHKK